MQGLLLPVRGPMYLISKPYCPLVVTCNNVTSALPKFPVVAINTPRVALKSRPDSVGSPVILPFPVPLNAFIVIG